MVIGLFEKVRDIPYGDIGSRRPEDVYKKNKGTCSGKHELLKELYHQLGIQTSDFIAMHRFKNLAIKYPQYIQTILDRSDIVDPHNFLKIKLGENWIIVDATWDEPLARLGFPVNENWDGESDMQICVQPFEIFETSDPIASKQQKVSEMSESARKDRALFLKELTVWLDGERK